MHLAVIFTMATAGAADCDAESLQVAIAGAESSFLKLDAEGFERNRAVVQDALGCQTAPVAPGDCALIHQLEGLAAFLADDVGGTLDAFRSAFASYPAYRLSTELAPEGHPLREQFLQARSAAPSASVELPRPRHGEIYVDGLRSRIVPSDRPFLVQHVLPTGAVQTTYATHVDAVPTYEARNREKPRKRVMLGIGIGSGVAAAALYRAAFASRAQYDAAVEVGDTERIEQTFRTTNGLVVGSAVALVTGAGLVIGSRF